MTFLSWAALAALILSVLVMLLPCGKRALPGEKQPTLSWLTALAGPFMAAGAPFFALETLSCALAAEPAVFPELRFGPLPWAFAALAAGVVCLDNAKRPSWLRALIAVSAFCAGIAALCFFAPIAGESFALVPVFSGAKLPFWLATVVCTAGFAALMFVRKRKQFINFALWPTLALVMIFLTGSGLAPLLRSLWLTCKAFFTGMFAPAAEGGAASGTPAFFSYWLCWSPILAISARRASSGRTVRQTMLGVYAAGLGAYLALSAVFGAFGVRLLDSLAQAGETTLALGATGAQTMAKLMLSLPFASMCAALLWLSALLMGIAALGAASENTAAMLCPNMESSRALSLCMGCLTGAAAVCSLYFTSAETCRRFITYSAIPSGAWLTGTCALALRRKS